MSTIRKVKINKSKKKVTAVVKFYDKSGKEIDSVTCYDRVPKAVQIQRIMPGLFTEAVLVTCKAEPVAKTPLRIFKNTLDDEKVSESAAKKFKAIGVNV